MSHRHVVPHQLPLSPLISPFQQVKAAHQSIQSLISTILLQIHISNTTLCNNIYTKVAPSEKKKAHTSPFRPSSTTFKLLSQSPQYPFTHSSTCFSFPCLAALSSSLPTLLHLCVSSSNQLSYSASTTSFSMRLTTRSATSRSCLCAPRF
jgi:hypothetical protein